MSALISMVCFWHFRLLFVGAITKSNKMISRWCNARQLAIDNARALINSEEYTYRIKKSGGVSDVDVVEKLLDDKAFHLGKTNSVSDLPTVG